MDSRVFRIGNFRIVVVSDGAAVGDIGARLVATRVAGNYRLVVALPTGRTPLPMYRELVNLCRKGVVDFSRTHLFNLDEVLGLARTHPASYAAYLRREFLDSINASPRRTHLLNGGTRCPLVECRRFEQRISLAGGLDLAILGIGRNGHIAFNEPGSPLCSRTRVVRLTAETIEDNDFSKYVGDSLSPSWVSHLDSSDCCRGKDSRGEAFAQASRSCRGVSANASPLHVVGSLLPLTRIPDNNDTSSVYALTMGIGTIIQAREIILMASGSEKAGIVSRALQGTPTSAVPASALQRHPNVTVILDREAAKDIDMSLAKKRVV